MEETRMEATEERRNKGYFISSMGTKFSIVLCRESQSVKMVNTLVLDSTDQREAESL